MEKSSQYITPVMLELGGKRPVIVDQNAPLVLSPKTNRLGKVYKCRTNVRRSRLCIHTRTDLSFIANISIDLSAL